MCMWHSDSFVDEVDARELAPNLLRPWVNSDVATDLMEYLWTASAKDQPECQDDPCADAQLIIRFLALARIVAEALNTADGSDEVTWEDLDLDPGCIPPMVIGFLASEEGLFLDSEMDLIDFLRDLGRNAETAVIASLSSEINESEFFMAIWGAHRGISSFPPSIEDMDEYDVDMNTVTSDTGRLFEYISDLWPHRIVRPTTNQTGGQVVG